MQAHRICSRRAALLLSLVVIAVLCLAAEPKEPREDQASWPPQKHVLLYLPFDKNVKPTIAWADGTTLAEPKPPHAPTLVKGIRGMAAQFDGKDDYLQLPALGHVKLEQFTLEAWIKPARATRGCLFINMADTHKSGIRFEKFYSAISFHLGDGARQYRCASPEYLIKEGFWQHVAATYDGREMRVFLNGKQIAHLKGPASIGPSNTRIRVGAYVNPKHYIYKGLLDEIVLFDKAKTADEIFMDMAQCVRERPNRSRRVTRTQQ